MVAIMFNQNQKYMTEEVTLQTKYTTWKVYKRGKESILTTPEPMTPADALYHFKAHHVQAVGNR